MKRIQYQKYGGPELMRFEDFKLPAPGKGQVAVKVKFAAINPIDWKYATGISRWSLEESFRVPWGATSPER